MHKWDPDDYHKNSPEQHRWGLELLDKIALRGNERIIDLGCGDGKISAEIATRVPLGSVLGIDKSEEMIRFAREHFSQERFPNLNFMAKDIRDLDFDRGFDLAFSNAVLHWVPDHAHALKTIAQGLKRGGRIVAQMGGKGNAEGILHILDTITARKKWAPHFVGFTAPYTFYDRAEYEDLLQKSGLRVERLERIPKAMVHLGAEGLTSWIRTTWLPYTRRVPEDLQFDFIDEIVDTYITTQGFDKNGIIHVEMVRLEFEAVREW
jgi:trans-aconitate 2-methyltransferase